MTPATRLLCVALVGTVVLILAVASHKEPCSWNGKRPPSYECSR